MAGAELIGKEELEQIHRLFEQSNVNLYRYGQNNFLAKEEFVSLARYLSEDEAPWYFSRFMVHPEEVSPGGFYHNVYQFNVPCSPIYNSHFLPSFPEYCFKKFSKINK